jgi:hypothetical protein
MDLATVMALGQVQVLEKVMGMVMVTGTETALVMAMAAVVEAAVGALVVVVC